MTWAPTPLESSLSYWSAPHPGWTPANDTPTGWPEIVASAAVDVTGAPLVLLDPLAPRTDADAFWSWLGERRAARGGLAILLSNRFHGRSAPEILARYPGTPVYSAAITDGRASVPVTHALRDRDVAPGGVVALALDGPEDGELAWHIPAARALFVADAVLGTGSGLRLAPPSWCKGASVYASVFASSVRGLLSLQATHVLTSHGPFTAGEGVAKLEAALAAVT